MSIAKSQLEALISSAKLELSKGSFPSLIFPFDEWILAWNELSSTPLTDEAKEKLSLVKQFASHLPLTIS